MAEYRKIYDEDRKCTMIISKEKMDEVEGVINVNFIYTNLSKDERIYMIQEIQKALSKCHFCFSLKEQSPLKKDFPIYDDISWNRKFNANSFSYDFVDTIFMYFRYKYFINTIKKCYGLSITLKMGDDENVYYFNITVGVNQIYTSSALVTIRDNKVIQPENPIKLKYDIKYVTLPLWKGKNYFEELDGNIVEIISEKEMIIRAYNSKNFNKNKPIFFNALFSSDPGRRLQYLDYGHIFKSLEDIDILFCVNKNIVFITINHKEKKELESKYTPTIIKLLKEKKDEEAYDFVEKNYEDIIKERKILHFMAKL